MCMSFQKAFIDGIESMPQNAIFVGNGVRQDNWTRSVVWSPNEIEVEENVEVTKCEEASGLAPAVNNDGEVNEEVKGWFKYYLER
mgnify:CR=1 FL=1